MPAHHQKKRPRQRKPKHYWTVMELIPWDGPDAPYLLDGLIVEPEDGLGQGFLPVYATKAAARKDWPEAERIRIEEVPKTDQGVALYVG